MLVVLLFLKLYEIGLGVYLESLAIFFTRFIEFVSPADSLQETIIKDSWMLRDIEFAFDER